ncbi:ABC transporter ATP-binding protein [Saccharicrinis fermentans]|uniref:Teichoic acids export ATP-binding protein TagH n=1 Tax=Saccharicrinis fermentans DSM 9555 = JCM 21142 TaxID=869213 RepID=W7YK80_9BACT|nr:ABC transporter ATP-binding protein [Saccharicrinis fermentans]GAF04946.1 teichoic acids export ATP-binding protein TagH [Saccharicrinis fermentans DSM 9555 = JCM 21142]
MTKTVIKIENLSKIYRLGEVGTGTLSHDLNRWFKMNLLGQDDPYAKVGQVNDRTQKAEKGELVAALRDINLEVKQGEVLGIIGKNGAGKSTLLKLLSRVTSPTTGSIKVKGRLASLLEVGTGFHPEMTGRENIYMNGTIMGMRKWEIDRKLDEIVDFAGVAKYLDTPTKRYSSGMTVRLGFAIAAHLEPEILVVDEVLAVGDAEFQKKAIGKMQDVSTNDGRTVLFVSHNMASITQLCTKGFILENGQSAYQGSTDDAINYYLSNSKNNNDKNIEQRADRINGSNFRFTELVLKTRDNKIIENATSGLPIKLKISYSLKHPLKNVSIRALFINNKGQELFLCNNAFCDKRIDIEKNGTITYFIPKLPLPDGQYYIQLTAYSENGIEDDIEGAYELNVDIGDYYNTGKVPVKKDGLYIDHNCTYD